jgi:hypothetical protein
LIRFYLAYALRSIQRGGQRSLLALSCIAFAVLSLVAMQLLAGMVRAATVVRPEAQLGGNLAVSRNRLLNDADVADLEQLRAAGDRRVYVERAEFAAHHGAPRGQRACSFPRGPSAWTRGRTLWSTPW